MWIQMLANYVVPCCRILSDALRREEKTVKPICATGRSDRPLSTLLDVPGLIKSAQICNEQFDWLLRHS